MAGVPARIAALLVGVNRHTATLFYHKLREVIAARLAEEASILAGEVEVDESYFGGVRKGTIRAGGVSAKRGSFATSTIRARSCSVSACKGVGRIASGRRSAHVGPPPLRQR